MAGKILEDKLAFEANVQAIITAGKNGTANENEQQPLA